MTVGEIMDSWLGGIMDDSCSLDRASAFVFCVPGWYVTEKSSCLSVVKPLGGPQIVQVAMIGKHCEWMFGTLEPMTPLLKCCLHS